MHIFLLSVSADPAFYEKWADILQNRNIAWDVFRELLWALVKLFIYVCDSCEKLLEYANQSLSFIISPSVVNFISQWKYIIYGILIIAILIFGISLMVNHKQDKSKLLQNILIAILVLTGITTATIQLTKNTKTFSMELLDTSTSTSAEKVVKDAVTDLYYLDAYDFSADAAQQKNGIPADSIKNIDPTENIKSSDDVNNPEVFSYKLNTDGKDGSAVLKDIDDGGIVDYNNDTYYRYHIDFVTIYITLFATAIVMIFTSFKVIKIVFDIIIHQIMAALTAAADWSSGQKLKEVIKSLLGLFFSVFMCSVMIKLYFLFAAWTSSNIKSGIARGFLLVFAAFAVIDGPNIVEKIFGVDAGLASTFRSVSTLFFASRGVASLAHAAGHSVNAAMRGVAHTGGAAGGFLSSLFENRNGNISDSSSSNGANKPNIANTAQQNKNSNNSNTDTSSNTAGKPNSNQTNEKQTDGKHSNNTANSNAKPNLNTSDSSRNMHNADGVNPGEKNNNSAADSQSISNKASQSKYNNGYDYWGTKARNPRSIAGAGNRGLNKGRYLGGKARDIGEKVGNKVDERRSRQEAKRNAKGE